MKQDNLASYVQKTRSDAYVFFTVGSAILVVLFFRESFDLRVWPILAVLMGVVLPMFLVLVGGIRKWFTHRRQTIESK